MNTLHKPSCTTRTPLFDSNLLCEGYRATSCLKHLVRDFTSIYYKFQQCLAKIYESLFLSVQNNREIFLE